MRVSVICFGAMRSYLPRGDQAAQSQIEVADGASVGDLVDALGAPRRLVFSALVDGERAELDRPLAEGAQVTLMPPFTGG